MKSGNDFYASILEQYKNINIALHLAGLSGYIHESIMAETDAYVLTINRLEKLAASSLIDRTDFTHNLREVYNEARIEGYRRYKNT